MIRTRSILALLAAATVLEAALVAHALSCVQEQGEVLVLELERVEVDGREVPDGPWHQVAVEFRGTHHPVRGGPPRPVLEGDRGATGGGNATLTIRTTRDSTESLYSEVLGGVD